MRNEKNIISTLRSIAKFLENECKGNPEFANRLNSLRISDLSFKNKKNVINKKVTTELPDIYEERKSRGNKEFQLWLVAQPLDILKEIVRLHDFDPAHKTTKWKEPVKLANYISESLENRMKKGESFERSLIKNEKKLSFQEKIEKERLEIESIRIKSEYMKTKDARDDMYNEGIKLLQMIESKCPIENLDKTKDGYLQITFSHIYMIVQFNPHHPENQLSCTFNEGWLVEQETGTRKYKFVILEYKFDLDENSNLGWNDGKKFYTSNELAEYLLNEVYDLNKSYFNKRINID